MAGVFDEDTAVEAVGDGWYRASISDRWNIGIVPNGGYVLAVGLAAVRAAVRQPNPLTVTAHYLAPAEEGPADVSVDVLKEGRSMSTASARLEQGGRTRLVVLATYGDLAAQTGPTIVRAAPPELPPPDRCAGRIAGPFATPPSISRVIDSRLGPAFTEWIERGRGGPAELAAWLRFADGREADVHALPLLCDALPPAVFAALETGWVPTLELTVHVRAIPSAGWLRGRVVTRVLVDGLCEEDCELWDEDDQLVAMSRQLARVLPPAR